MRSMIARYKIEDKRKKKKKRSIEFEIRLLLVVKF